MNQISRTHHPLSTCIINMVTQMPDSAPTSQLADDDTEILAPDGQEKAIGERLAQARTAAKLSKAALAKVIGRRGAQVITDYEAGTSKVRLSTVRQIAAATGADVTWLWLGREPQTASAIQAPAADDTALIANCESLLRIIDHINGPDFDIDSDVDDPQHEEQERLATLILAAVPTTFAGHQMRARAYLEWTGGVDGKCEPASVMDGAEMWPILRDLANAATTLSLGSVSAQVAPRLADDQRLIEIGAEAARLIEQRAVFEAQWWATPVPSSENYSQENRDTLTAIAADMDGSADRLDALTDESITLAATSIETLRAKARLGQFWMRMNHADKGVMDPETLDNDDQVLWSLLNDILGAPSAASAIGPSPEITNAIAVVDAAQSVMSEVFTKRAGDEEFNAAADIQGRAIDACGAVRIATMADASAIARIALRHMADGDVAGSADEVVLGLLKSLAQHVPDAPNPDADIIAHCEKVEEIWARYWQACEEQDALPDDQQVAHEQKVVFPLYNEAFEIYDQITEGPNPKTSQGARAIARAAVVTASDRRGSSTHEIEMGQPGLDLAWKLVGHLAGLEVNPSQVAA